MNDLQCVQHIVTYKLKCVRFSCSVPMSLLSLLALGSVDDGCSWIPWLSIPYSPPPGKSVWWQFLPTYPTRIVAPKVVECINPSAEEDWSRLGEGGKVGCLLLFRETCVVQSGMLIDPNEDASEDDRLKMSSKNFMTASSRKRDSLCRRKFDAFPFRLRLITDFEIVHVLQDRQCILAS